MQGNKSAIAEYRNTKVAELTPQQSLVTRILATLIALVAIIAAAALTSSTAVTPRITATFSPELTIDYLVHASPTEQQCLRVTSGFTQSISQACPDCEIKSSCSVGDLYKAELEALPDSTLAARLPNGAAAYLTEDRELALSLCASSVAEEVFAMPISPKQTTSESSLAPYSRPCSIARCAKSRDIAGSAALFDVPAPSLISIKPFSFEGGFATPQSTT